MVKWNISRENFPREVINPDGTTNRKVEYSSR